MYSDQMSQRLKSLNSLIEFLCQLVKCVIQWLSVSDLGVPIELFWKRMKELHSWRLSIVKKKWSYWHSLLSHVSSERNQSSCSKYSNIIIQIHKRTKRDKYTNLVPKNQQIITYILNSNKPAWYQWMNRWMVTLIGERHLMNT